MSTELKKYTFKSLIGSEFETADKKVVQIKEIIIPRIQRDYAQGRTGKFEERVRSRFLDALYTAINNKQNITFSSRDYAIIFNDINITEIFDDEFQEQRKILR